MFLCFVKKYDIFDESNYFIRGYKMYAYLNGIIADIEEDIDDNKHGYDEMVYVLKRETRHFAKRQLTWFKREDDVIWLDKDKADENELLNEMIQILKDKQVIGNE